MGRAPHRTGSPRFTRQRDRSTTSTLPLLRDEARGFLWHPSAPRDTSCPGDRPTLARAFVGAGRSGLVGPRVARWGGGSPMADSPGTGARGELLQLLEHYEAAYRTHLDLTHKYFSIYLTLM